MDRWVGRWGGGGLRTWRAQDCQDGGHPVWQVQGGWGDGGTWQEAGRPLCRPSYARPRGRFPSLTHPPWGLAPAPATDDGTDSHACQSHQGVPRRGPHHLPQPLYVQSPGIPRGPRTCSLTSLSGPDLQRMCPGPPGHTARPWQAPSELAKPQRAKYRAPGWLPPCGPQRQ